jgi:hypothetical protein
LIIGFQHKIIALLHELTLFYLPPPPKNMRYMRYSARLAAFSAWPCPQLPPRTATALGV